MALNKQVYEDILCGQKIQMSLFLFGYGVSPPRVAPLDFTPTPSHSQ
jgi:hypothetical protein